MGHLRQPPTSECPNTLNPPTLITRNRRPGIRTTFSLFPTKEVLGHHFHTNSSANFLPQRLSRVSNSGFPRSDTPCSRSLSAIFKDFSTPLRAHEDAENATTTVIDLDLKVWNGRRHGRPGGNAVECLTEAEESIKESHCLGEVRFVISTSSVRGFTFGCFTLLLSLVGAAHADGVVFPSSWV